MIMKANKQIGFIYKDNESIDRILKDGEVVFERGFLREKTSTTLPITFGGIGKDLKDYKVYGNTVQNGEPTPDAPIDMVSCGDRTKNLFDKNNVNIFTGNPKKDSYVMEGGIYNRCFYMQCKPNTTYTVYKRNDGDVNRFCVATSDTIPTTGSPISKQIRDDATDSITITSNNNDTYIIVHFYRTYETVLTMQQLLDSIMVVEGSIATSYEPYYEGYKIPVNVRSENLFDKDNYEYITAYLSSSNIITNSGNAVSFYIKCKPNTTYNVSKTSLFGNDRFCLFDISSLPTVGDIALSYSGTKTGYNGSTNLTITTNPTAQYLCIFVKASPTAPSASTQDIANTLQIVEGSTVPSKYIPYYNQTTNIYLDEPLRKIGEYSDYIDFINGKVVRNINEIILNGSESWATAVTRNNYNKVARQFLLENAILNQGNSSNITKSTHFGIKSANNIYSNSSIGVNCIGISDSGYLRIGLDLTVFPGDNSFKTWLSENNVTVDYVLATPTEESITLPNIPTIDGNNTLNIETEITPSQVYIKYKSNT